MNVHYKYYNRATQKFVVFTEAAKKELEQNKSLKKSLKFVGECDELGELTSKENKDYFAEAKTPKTKEPNAVEEILKANGNDKKQDLEFEEKDPDEE